MPYLKTLDQRHRIRISGSAITVGSDPGSHIPIRPPFVVASQQFTLIESGGRYMIQNADPAGRTHVNGHPVEEAWLKDGDVIHAGDLALLFTSSPDETGDTAPLPQRASTPFRTDQPEPQESAKAEAQPEKEPEPESSTAEPPTREINYDETITTHLEPEDLLPASEYEIQAKRRSTQSAAPFWLLVAAIMLCCALWWNRDAIIHSVPLLRQWNAAEHLVRKHQPNPLTPELAEHLSAVQMVATLPPSTFASVALSDLFSKTGNPWVKERVDKQVVRALSPLVHSSGEIERLTLINGSLPTSRFVVLSLKGRPGLKDLIKDVAPGSQQEVDLNGYTAVRLKTGAEQARYVVEITPGQFIVTDVTLERLRSHFNLQAKVKTATGVVAMSRNWPAGFVALLNPVRLAKEGVDTMVDSLTTAPIMSVDFQSAPTVDIVVPTTAEQSTRCLAAWRQKEAEVAANLADLGTVTLAEMTATDSAVELRSEISTGTLLDEVWRKHFNDLDLKFRPLGMGREW